jgi:GNAT superfamily N-acetyltransferase
MIPKINVREAQSEDCARVLELMMSLAEFEGYLPKFLVTESDVEQYCIRQKLASILVAEVDSKIEGLLVYFLQPFTYDLRPWLIIKELYVTKASRGLGIGKKLFFAVQQAAETTGTSKIKWEVLKDNKKALEFYRSLGATLETNWRIMSITSQ